jgi:hypothetical protein
MSLPRSFRTYFVLLLSSGAGACSGLIAGPESSSITPIPASRDSAYARSRRALQGESFTLDLVDSAGGRLTGTRWPSASARQGTSAACHVRVSLRIKGNENSSEVASSSRWVAPGRMNDVASSVCEQERIAVLDRTAQVLVPPTTP